MGRHGTIRNPLKRAGGILNRMGSTLASLSKIPKFLRDPALARSGLPAEARKPRLRIWVDQIEWAIRNVEVNESYFVYGLDRKGSDPGSYIGSREGMALIRGANSRSWAGIRATDYRCLCKDKFVFGQYLAALSFPTPKVLALYDGYQVRWLDRPAAAGLGSVGEREGLDVFCKDAIGAHGHDVFPLRVQQGRIFIDGTEVTVEELETKMPVPALFQERLVQHPVLAGIYPHSVNTFRLVTVMRDGKASPFTGFFRFGVRGNRVDNWGAGGVAVGVDLESGELLRWGVFKPGQGSITLSHPESGFRFEGFKIPFFEHALDLAVRLHGFFYGLKSIGWDIAFTSSGPVFLEANHSWEIWPMQAMVGGLKAELRQALSPPRPASRRDGPRD